MANSRIDFLNALHGRPLRLLLVCPQFPPSYWSFHYVGRFAGKTATMPPLGLLTLAALCPPGWDIRLIDENVEPLTDADLHQADLVCVGSMINQYSRAVRISRRARALGKPTAIGGPHVTGEPEVYEAEFDILIRNEAEVSWPIFLADYARGSVRMRYESDAKADLASTPVARFDLIRHPRSYMNFAVQFSRGCPFDCEFCDVTRSLGRRMRTRPTRAILLELDAIHALGYRGPVFIADDNFTANRKSAIRMCRAIAEWNAAHRHPFTYYTQASIDLASRPELLEALADAGFNSVFVGIETPSETSLSESGKHQNIGIDTAEAVRIIQRHGIRVDGGFIVGFDNDKPDIFERQARFIERINVSAAMMGILTAPPGSAMWDRLKREGRLLVERTPLNLDGEEENYNVGGLQNIQPGSMSLPVLMRGYADLLSAIYNPRTYFQRVVRQIALLESRSLGWRFTMRNALIRLPLLTLFVVLFFPCRGDYLLAAGRILWRYPGRLADFSTLVLRGIHFIELTRRDAAPWARRVAAQLEATAQAGEGAPPESRLCQVSSAAGNGPSARSNIPSE